MTNVTRNKKCSKNNNMINQQDKKIKIKVIEKLVEGNTTVDAMAQM